jgi:photosystem II stability/assembly factor-like uncharacterized protein
MLSIADGRRAVNIRRIARLIAAVTFGVAALAHAAVEPCGKNHYILSEPCALAWTAVNTGLTDLDVHVVAVDPVNKATLYAGGPTGLFKSIDGGAKWRMTGLDMEARAIADTAVAFERFDDLPPWWVASSIVTQLAIDAAHPNTLYASTVWRQGCTYLQARLFKSADGGASWTDTVSPGINGCDNIHSLLLTRGNPGTLYLTNYDDSVGDTASPLVRSTDGAATWMSLEYLVLHVLAADPLDASVVYGGTFDFEPYFTNHANGVLKSSDGGATWAATGLTGFGISALTLAPGSPSTLYAATFHSGTASTFQGLLKSVDGGQHWAPAGNGLSHLIGSQSYVTAVAVDPRDPNKVYLATSGSGIMLSTDAGATWTPLNDGLPSLQVRSLAFAAGSTPALYAGTAAGVFRFTDYRRDLGAKEAERF